MVVCGFVVTEIETLSVGQAWRIKRWDPDREDMKGSGGGNGVD